MCIRDRARCSLDGSKLWFNCNPDTPLHWFYEEWIKKSAEKNRLYLHFTMDDNPSLTPAIKRRYESLYSGAFYDRFVPVSYTHLDVYKRQLQSRTHITRTTVRYRLS